MKIEEQAPEGAEEQEGQGGGEEQQSEMLSPDILPEELRGRDPAEVRLILSQMPKIIQNQRDELERVKTLGESPPPPPAAQEQEQQVDLKTMMDEDPEGALEYYITKKYGPQISSMESRIGESEINRFAQNYPEFVDYEDDVRQILTESGQPATPQNLHGAFAMALGNRQILSAAQKRRAEAEGLKNSPPPQQEEQTRELTSLEADVAKSLGLSAEDYLKYGDPESDLSDLIGVE